MGTKVSCLLRYKNQEKLKSIIYVPQIIKKIGFVAFIFVTIKYLKMYVASAMIILKVTIII